MNEESDYVTFRSSRGTSNIDLTVISDHLLRTVVEWEISEEESCSDHSIIRYTIGQSLGHRTEFDVQEVRHIVKKVNKGKFQGNLIRIAKKKLRKLNKGGTDDFDKTLCTHVTDENDIEKLLSFAKLWN